MSVRATLRSLLQGTVVIAILAFASPRAVAQEDVDDPKLKPLQELLQKAQALEGEGDYKGAVEAYNRAEPIYPPEAQREVLYWHRGKAKSQLKDYAGAEADLDRALKLRPDFPLALLARGEVRWNAGNVGGALKDFERAAALEPKEPMVYSQRGYLYLSAGKAAKALPDFDRAIALQPDNPRNFLRRATAHRLLGNTRAVIADCDAGIKLPLEQGSTDVEQFYHLRARARLQLDDVDGALADAQQAIDAGEDDNDLDLSVIRAFATARKGKIQDAADILTVADTSRASSPYAEYWGWIIRSGGGNRSLAAAGLQDYLRGGDPGLDTWRKAIGQLLAGERSENQLVDLAESAAPEARSRRLAEAWFYSGTVRRINGDWSGAETDYRRCIATGETATAEYMLAESELSHVEKSWGEVEQTRYNKYVDWLKAQQGLPRYKAGGPLIRAELGSARAPASESSRPPMTTQRVVGILGRPHDQVKRGWVTAYVAADLLTNKTKTQVSATDLAISTFMYQPSAPAEFSKWDSTGTVAQILQCCARSGCASEADIRSDWLWRHDLSPSEFIQSLEGIGARAANPEQADEMSRQVVWTFFPELNGQSVAAVLLNKPKEQYFAWLAFLEASGRRHAMPELHYVETKVADLATPAALMTMIDGQLDAGNVIAVSYGSTAATLVGSRPEGTERRYLLRHSFRHKWSPTDDPGTSIDPADPHYLWVTAAWLGSHVTDVCYVE